MQIITDPVELLEILRSWGDVRIINTNNDSDTEPKLIISRPTGNDCWASSAAFEKVAECLRRASDGKGWFVK